MLYSVSMKTEESLSKTEKKKVWQEEVDKLGEAFKVLNTGPYVQEMQYGPFYQVVGAIASAKMRIEAKLMDLEE